VFALFCPGGYGFKVDPADQAAVTFLSGSYNSELFFFSVPKNSSSSGAISFDSYRDYLSLALIVFSAVLLAICLFFFSSSQFARTS